MALPATHPPRPTTQINSYTRRHTNRQMESQTQTHTQPPSPSRVPSNSQAARVALFSRPLPPPPVNERWKVARSSHSMLFPSRFIYRLIVGGPARPAPDFTAVPEGGADTEHFLTMSRGGAPSSSLHLGPSAPLRPLRLSPQRDRMRVGAGVSPEGASARPSSRQWDCGVLARPRRQQTQPGGEGAFNPSLR